MMLHFLMVLTTLLFSGSPAQTWYFGQLTASKQVIAYTSSGDVHPLDITGDAQYGVRIDAQNALFLLTDSRNVAHLYHVTPNTATEIATPGSPDQLRQALAASGSYVVLREADAALANALLINVATNQAVTLTGRVPQLARISQDGKFLRYMSTDGSDWSLIERTLATGQERIIYTVASSNPAPILDADQYGERWLYTDDEPNSIDAFHLISADGTRIALRTTGNGTWLEWRFLDGDLIGSAADCGDHCTLEIRSPTADTTLSLPTAGIYQPLGEPQPGLLLTFDSNDNFWLLRPRDTAIKLGSYDTTQTFMSITQLISPDGRYLLTQTTAGMFSVLDLTSARPVAQIKGISVGQIFYTAQGFTIHSYGDTSGSDQAVAYRYSDGQTIPLPNAGTSLYFDMLPDGTLLDWNQTQTDSVGAAGIYRYNPATQTYTLIVANARVLVAHPAS